MKQVKAMWDPNCILNPGKILEIEGVSNINQV